jgi:hypothetical protein
MTFVEPLDSGGSSLLGDARQPRLHRAELRSLLLDAGRTILLERGLQTQASSLTFKAALDRVEADTGLQFSNASIIGRIWKDQREFRLEVLNTFASVDFRSEIDIVLSAIAPVLADSDLSTEASRSAAIREVCRVGGARHVEALRDSSTFALWIGIWSIAASSDSSTEQRELHEALTEGYEAINSHFEEAFGALMNLLMVQVRKPLTVRQFADAVGALVEGCSIRDRVTDGMANILRPTGPEGQMQEWTTFSIGLVALATEFFEPIPS